MTILELLGFLPTNGVNITPEMVVSPYEMLKLVLEFVNQIEIKIINKSIEQTRMDIFVLKTASNTLISILLFIKCFRLNVFML